MPKDKKPAIIDPKLAFTDIAVGGETYKSSSPEAERLLTCSSLVGLNNPLKLIPH